MAAQIVERYLPRNVSWSWTTTYKNVFDLVNTVYVIEVDGRETGKQYKTREEAEEAKQKLDRESYINKLKAEAEKKLKDLIEFRLKLSYMNCNYMQFKNKTYTPTNRYIEKFKEDNPVIRLLPKDQKRKCYLVLMKAAYKKAINEYYSKKKEYIDAKNKVIEFKNGKV